MKLLSYDIELWNDFVQDAPIETNIPSIAGIATSDVKEVMFYFDLDDEAKMKTKTAQELVNTMMGLYKEGYIPFGWNTTDFDFKLLAYTSGMFEECGELALNGIDGMLMISFNRGYFLALDKALVGAEVGSKLHEVTLNDGTIFTEMKGDKAPALWRAGEYSAVTSYLREDVLQPLKLADVIEERGGIRWKANSGNMNFCKQKLVPVTELFKLPPVKSDTSWMATPPKPRLDYVKWIPKNILDKYGIG